MQRHLQQAPEPVLGGLRPGAQRALQRHIGVGGHDHQPDYVFRAGLVQGVQGHRAAAGEWRVRGLLLGAAGDLCDFRAAPLKVFV